MDKSMNSSILEQSSLVSFLTVLDLRALLIALCPPLRVRKWIYKDILKNSTCFTGCTNNIDPIEFYYSEIFSKTCVHCEGPSDRVVHGFPSCLSCSQIYMPRAEYKELRDKILKESSISWRVPQTVRQEISSLSLCMKMMKPLNSSPLFMSSGDVKLVLDAFDHAISNGMKYCRDTILNRLPISGSSFLNTFTSMFPPVVASPFSIVAKAALPEMETAFAAWNENTTGLGSIARFVEAESQMLKITKLVFAVMERPAFNSVLQVVESGVLRSGLGIPPKVFETDLVQRLAAILFDLTPPLSKAELANPPSLACVASRLPRNWNNPSATSFKRSVEVFERIVRTFTPVASKYGNKEASLEILMKSVNEAMTPGMFGRGQVTKWAIHLPQVDEIALERSREQERVNEEKRKQIEEEKQNAKLEKMKAEEAERVRKHEAKIRKIEADKYRAEERKKKKEEKLIRDREKAEEKAKKIAEREAKLALNPTKRSKNTRNSSSAANTCDQLLVPSMILDALEPLSPLEPLLLEISPDSLSIEVPAVSRVPSPLLSRVPSPCESPNLKSQIAAMLEGLPPKMKKPRVSAQSEKTSEIGLTRSTSQVTSENHVPNTHKTRVSSKPTKNLEGKAKVPLTSSENKTEPSSTDKMTRLELRRSEREAAGREALARLTRATLEEEEEDVGAALRKMLENKFKKNS